MQSCARPLTSECFSPVFFDENALICSPAPLEAGKVSFPPAFSIGAAVPTIEIKTSDGGEAAWLVARAVEWILINNCS